MFLKTWRCWHFGLNGGPALHKITCSVSSLGCEVKRWLVQTGFNKWIYKCDGRQPSEQENYNFRPKKRIYKKIQWSCVSIPHGFISVSGWGRQMNSLESRRQFGWFLCLHVSCSGFSICTVAINLHFNGITKRNVQWKIPKLLMHFLWN